MPRQIRVQFSLPQRHFLRDVSHCEFTLEQIMSKLGVTDQSLARWLRRKKFRRALARRKHEIWRRIELEIMLNCLAAVRANGRVMINSSDRQLAQRAMETAFQMELDRRQIKKLPAATGASNHKKWKPAGAHPDVPEAEAERLRCSLEGELRRRVPRKKQEPDSN